MNHFRFLKKFNRLNTFPKLLLIVFLWLGGVYAFQAINSLNIFPWSVPAGVTADGPIDLWWPISGARISNTQAFKAMIKDKNVSEYSMFWAVDDGQQNPMYDSSVDYPHKEAVVDLKDWTWKGAGPYKVTFKAIDKDNNPIAETSVEVFTTEPARGPVEVEAAPQPSSNTISAALGINSVDASSKTLNVVFPTNNVDVKGLTTFKARLDGASLDSYQMYWQVDNGNLNGMDIRGDYKEASVDTTNWSWRGNGPYTISIVAKNGSTVLAKSDVSITIGKSSTSAAPLQPQTQTQTVQVQEATISRPIVKPKQQALLAAPAPQTTTQPVSGNPLSGVKFFVNPYSNAKRTADEWRQSRPTDASQMDKIAGSPEAIWLGGWNSNVQSDVANKISAAKSQGAVPVFIAYNIPNRDCGSYSAGGVGNADAYKSWIEKIAAGLGGNKAVIVLEPDALTLIDCLNQDQKNDRFSMISNAITALKNAGALVYLDAGHSSWIAADEMANRLNSAGISKADGFSLNTSNFQTTQSNIDYGTTISGKLGGKHFIIDTARNGNGPASGNEWCNPAGRALGNRATASTGNSLVDAYLWLKNPGESDGNCNGGPSAGVWWPEYALGLAQRASF
jgi:endoglucanase